MSSLITTTEVNGQFASMVVHGQAYGTTGRLSLDSITLAAEEIDPRFAVMAVTASNGGFVANLEKK